MLARLPLLFRRTLTQATPTSKDSKRTAIVVERDDLVGPDLRWALRIARLGDADLLLLVCPPERIAGGGACVDLCGSTEQTGYAAELAERVRDALDLSLGEGKWMAARPAEGAEPGEAPEAPTPSPRSVELRLFQQAQLIEGLERAGRGTTLDLVVFVAGADAERRKEWIDVVRSLARSSTCSIALVVPGPRQEDGELLVAAGRTRHGRIAIDLAAALAEDGARALTALYVEKDLGPDAESVGERVLDRRLASALEQPPSRLSRRVVVDDDDAKGILGVCQEERYEVLLLGASRQGAMGREVMGVALRTLRARPEVTVITVRTGVPLGGRFQRRIEEWVQLRVPQLDREGRVRVVDQIQSNSRWNFDFILLMALSTLIAAMGLLDDSAAVIIGAMLIAPLMTPLLGLGLSLAQGNQRLARMTLKSTLLGFLTAFLISYVAGVFSAEFIEPTGEMNARDWPQMLDLGIAFVSGLAAAYAYSRPGLLAALPGVAIAAALVPPVATSGLAVSIGEFGVAFGALLLFGVNIVAIVGAAAISLWAVGVRRDEKGRTLTRVLNYTLAGTTIVLVLALTFSPPLLAPPAALVRAVEEELADEYRLRGMELDERMGETGLQVDLGGVRFPDIELRERLHERAREHLGPDATLRVTFRFETFME